MPTVSTHGQLDRSLIQNGRLDDYDLSLAQKVPPWMANTSLKRLEC